MHMICYRSFVRRCTSRKWAKNCWIIMRVSTTVSVACNERHFSVLFLFLSSSYCCIIRSCLSSTGRLYSFQSSTDIPPLACLSTSLIFCQRFLSSLAKQKDHLLLNDKWIWNEHGTHCSRRKCTHAHTHARARVHAQRDWQEEEKKRKSSSAVD